MRKHCRAASLSEYWVPVVHGIESLGHILRLDSVVEGAGVCLDIDGEGFDVV